MGTVVGLVFPEEKPVEEAKAPAKGASSKVITSKGKKKKVEKTREDIEMEMKEEKA